MTVFPDSASFKLVDQNSGQPISNLAVRLTLFARRKNNYYIWSISDTQGVATLTKAQCLREIEDSRTTWLMDYASTLEECLPRISIEVLSESDIKRSIETRYKYREFFPDNLALSEEYIHRLETCNNYQYVPDKVSFEEATLWQPGPLTIRVKRLLSSSS